MFPVHNFRKDCRSPAKELSKLANLLIGTEHDDMVLGHHGLVGSKNRFLGVHVAIVVLLCSLGSVIAPCLNALSDDGLAPSNPCQCGQVSLRWKSLRPAGFRSCQPVHHARSQLKPLFTYSTLTNTN